VRSASRAGGCLVALPEDADHALDPPAADQEREAGDAAADHRSDRTRHDHSAEADDPHDQRADAGAGTHGNRGVRVPPDHPRARGGGQEEPERLGCRGFRLRRRRADRVGRRPRRSGHAGSDRSGDRRRRRRLRAPDRPPGDQGRDRRPLARRPGTRRRGRLIEPIWGRRPGSRLRLALPGRNRLLMLDTRRVRVARRQPGAAMTDTERRARARRSPTLSIAPLFASETEAVPRHELPAGEMAPDVAYQVIHDELMLDGNARMNVATFVSTWMEPQAERLMAECSDKNMIDKDEYPQTAEIERRCVNILASLWHAPAAAGDAAGCSTTGSSEAAMLGGLALKRLWQKRRAAEGKPADKPNIVMGINVQICWEKLANYWDVEMRLVPMEGERFTLSAEEAVKLCDENTIGVVAILGSTFD